MLSFKNETLPSRVDLAELESVEESYSKNTVLRPPALFESESPLSSRLESSEEESGDDIDESLEAFLELEPQPVKATDRPRIRTDNNERRETDMDTPLS